MIFSLEIEQQFLATLLQYPENYVKVADFITYKDFYGEKSKVNQTVFSVMKQILEKNEELDPSVVIDRVKKMGVTFDENLSVYDYIHALGMRKTSEKALITLAKELKKHTVRRDIYDSARKVAAAMKEIDASASYSEIVNTADKTFNKKINFYESGADIPVNIMEEMSDIIEFRGENPIEEFGLAGPYPKTQDIYGSLVRPGNITVVVARSGVGKTTLCMDYSTKMAINHGVPILHFDNGEMSKDELIMRQCSALSGVPMHLLETGKWRNHSAEMVEQVRKVWGLIKPLKFYYYGVGGMDVDEMITILKRFYYSTVGRGNKMIFSFDYIKPHRGGSHMVATHEKIGFMMDAFKTAIKDEIKHNNDPIIPMVTSVQSNRMGITHNRTADSIVDDESIVSLSDHITQYCSHMFILRKKTMDELEFEGELFGTHKLICIKPRHLGRDYAGHLEPVLVGDRLRNNFINLDFKGFNIEERGDLRDIVAHRTAHAELETVDDGLPPSRQTQNSNGPIQQEIPDFGNI